MDFNRLRCFLTIAEELNMTRAAEKLLISQPSLSRYMMELEDELGQPLFIRGKRRLELTTQGQLLKERAAQIIALVDKTAIDISSSKEELSGTIYLAAAETDGILLVGTVMKELTSVNPRIKLDIHSGDGISVRERIDKGLADFGLVYGVVDSNKYHSIELPYADQWGVIMRSDDELASKTVIKRSDLLNKPILTSRGSLRSGVLQKWFDSDIDSLNIVVVGNLILNTLKLVLLDYGYLFALYGLVDIDNSSDYVFVPVEPRIDYPLKFIWKRHYSLSPAASEFLRLMQEQYDKK